MSKFFLFTIIFTIIAVPAAYGGENIVGTRTGDPEMDRSLKDLNEGAKDNVRGFARNLSRYFNLPEETADWLLESVGMSPSDAYMAAKVSKVADKPVENVVDEYKKNKGKGWGVMAKNLGIKPGSKAFHQLKKDDTGLLEDTKAKNKKAKKKKAKGKGKGKNKGKKSKKSLDDE